MTDSRDLSAACQHTGRSVALVHVRPAQALHIRQPLPKGFTDMPTRAHLTQQHATVNPTEPDALFCLTSRLDGPGDRAGVGVGLRAALRLDTDGQTDPLHHPTAQLSPHNSKPTCIQTDPSRGLPGRGVDEHIR